MKNREAFLATVVLGISAFLLSGCKDGQVKPVEVATPGLVEQTLQEADAALLALAVSSGIPLDPNQKVWLGPQDVVERECGGPRERLVYGCVTDEGKIMATQGMVGVATHEGIHKLIDLKRAAAKRENNWYEWSNGNLLIAEEKDDGSLVVVQEIANAEEWFVRLTVLTLGMPGSQLLELDLSPRNQGKLQDVALRYQQAPSEDLGMELYLQYEKAMDPTSLSLMVRMAKQAAQEKKLVGQEAGLFLPEPELDLGKLLDEYIAAMMDCGRPNWQDYLRGNLAK